MDTSLTVKPRDTLARSNTRAGTVRTDLAPSQSVSAVNPADATHNNVALQDAVARDLVDPQSREVIYREREERNRRRAPDKALMRQRAYGQAAPSGEPHHDADIEV